jgi:hypothetical protein
MFSAMPIYIYILFLSNHSTFDMSLHVMLATEKFGSPVMYLENAKFDLPACQYCSVKTRCLLPSFLLYLLFVKTSFTYYSTVNTK